MKRFILIITMLFSLTASCFAKQFCIKINCYKTDGDRWGSPTVHVNVEDEINKYLNKGYKLIAVTPEITTSTYASYTIRYYCIFDDGKE